MQNRTKLVAGCLTTVAVLALGVFWAGKDVTQVATVVDAARPAQATQQQHAPTSVMEASTTTSAMQARLHSVSPRLNMSKASQFEEYVKRGTPADKFQAYLLAHSCVASTKVRRSFEMIPLGERTAEVKEKIESGEFKADQDAACGDLTDRQILARVDYAKDAAEAGVPGAAIYLSSEPPFGDAATYDTRPDDLAVLEYRRHIVDLIKLAASKGDAASMTVLVNMYATGQGEVEGRDPVKALQYHIAMRDAMAKAGSKMLPYVDRRTKDLEQGLAVEQIESAKRFGHLIALGETK